MNMDGLAQWHKESELSILEDYVVAGLGEVCALIHREAPPRFLEGVRAAAVSSRLGISLTHALKRHVAGQPADRDLPAVFRLYQEIYFAGKRHIEATLARFQAGAEPRASEVFADAALRRLQATYFAAGLLFRTGHLFEARAVARVFLEQVAWAYGVYVLERTQPATKVSPSKAIGVLKQLFPRVGRLYGELSDDTHLDLKSHRRFLRVHGGYVTVLLTHGRLSCVSGAVLLDLADCWSVVYERTQWQYMSTVENWDASLDGPRLKVDRPFAALAESLRARLAGVES